MMDKRETIKQQLLKKFPQGSEVAKTVLSMLSLYSEEELDLVEQLLKKGPEKNLKKRVKKHLETTIQEFHRFKKKVQRKRRTLEEESSKKRDEEILKKLL